LTVGQRQARRYLTEREIERLMDTACKHSRHGHRESTVSKRRDSPYSSGRSRDWIKSKNPNAPAVKREAEEDSGKSCR
jgi:ATP-dependent DNA ligase